MAPRQCDLRACRGRCLRWEMASTSAGEVVGKGLTRGRWLRGLGCPLPGEAQWEMGLGFGFRPVPHCE